MNQFFDVPAKKEQGSDQSIDWDRQFFVPLDQHRASSTISGGDYDDEGDFY